MDPSMRALLSGLLEMLERDALVLLVGLAFLVALLSTLPRRQTSKGMTDRELASLDASDEPDESIQRMAEQTAVLRRLRERAAERRAATLPDHPAREAVEGQAHVGTSNGRVYPFAQRRSVR